MGYQDIRTTAINLTSAHKILLLTIFNYNIASMHIVVNDHSVFTMMNLISINMYKLKFIL